MCEDICSHPLRISLLARKLIHLLYPHQALLILTWQCLILKQRPGDIKKAHLENED